MKNLTYEEAEQIAIRAHKGQKKSDGIAYINHSLRVAAILTGETDKIVGILHEVLSNAGCKLVFNEAPLQNPNVNKEVVGYAIVEADGSFHKITSEVSTALTLLVHKDKEVTYNEYIENLSCNPIANRVKIADIVDNLIGNTDVSQEMKYRLAMRVLLKYK